MVDWKSEMEYYSKLGENQKSFMKEYKKLLKNDLKLKEMQSQLTSSDLKNSNNISEELVVSEKKKKKMFLTHLDKSKSQMFLDNS